MTRAQWLAFFAVLALCLGVFAIDVLRHFISQWGPL